eukprot:627572-Pelagomonas_calceolata.AAC.1
MHHINNCRLYEYKYIHTQVTFQTSHGQLLDLITAAPGGEVDLDKYTLDNYMRIVTYKTAFYSFYLPIACGMLLAGISDPAAYKVRACLRVRARVCMCVCVHACAWTYCVCEMACERVFALVCATGLVVREVRVNGSLPFVRVSDHGYSQGCGGAGVRSRRCGAAGHNQDGLHSCRTKCSIHKLDLYLAPSHAECVCVCIELPALSKSFRVSCPVLIDGAHC